MLGARQHSISLFILLGTLSVEVAYVVAYVVSQWHRRRKRNHHVAARRFVERGVHSNVTMSPHKLFALAKQHLGLSHTPVRLKSSLTRLAVFYDSIYRYLFLHCSCLVLHRTFFGFYNVHLSFLVGTFM